MERKPMPPQLTMAGRMTMEEEDAVRAFLAIVSRAQTRELCKWNAESLRRALRWSAIVEAAAVRAAQQPEQEEDAAFRTRFPLATLPTLEPGSLLHQSDLKRGDERTCVVYGRYGQWR
jgi:hypothetical protein